MPVFKIKHNHIFISWTLCPAPPKFNSSWHSYVTCLICLPRVGVTRLCRVIWSFVSLCCPTGVYFRNGGYRMLLSVLGHWPFYVFSWHVGQGEVIPYTYRQSKGFGASWAVMKDSQEQLNSKWRAELNCECSIDNQVSFRNNEGFFQCLTYRILCLIYKGIPVNNSFKVLSKETQSILSKIKWKMPWGRWIMSV